MSSTLSEEGPETEVTVAPASSSADTTESLGRPYPLSFIGLGAAFGLFSRLVVASGFITTINSRGMSVVAGATSAIIGVGLLLVAKQRDRLAAPLIWIAAITALAWGAFNWIAPPFPDTVTVWSESQQLALSLLGIGNGLLLAGLIVLAFVRRTATLSVAAIMVTGAVALAANTILVRTEWAAVIAFAVAFSLNLLAWDRMPRRESVFEPPERSPRVSRAALSLISVALSGAAIQQWLGRTETPRSLPAVIVCIVLIAGAFASMIRVRREIERRETTLSEWRGWWRESRSTDFRAEMANFEPSPAATESPEAAPELPRQLSFPNLADADEFANIATSEDPVDTRPKLSDFMAPSNPAPTNPAPTSPAPTSAPEILVPSASGIAAELSAIEVDVVEKTTPKFQSMIADYSSVEQDKLIADRLPTSPTDPLSAAQLPAARIVADPVPDADPQPVAAAAPPDSRRLPRINLSPDTPPLTATAPAKPSGGVFSHYALPDVAPKPAPRISVTAAAPVTPAQVAAPIPVATALPVADPSPVVQTPPFVGDLEDLSLWLSTSTTGATHQRLLVPVEAMPLVEFDELAESERSEAQEAIGGFLAQELTAADVVAWIDGPYFIVAFEHIDARDLKPTNLAVTKLLRDTNGVHALMRTAPDATFDEVVSDAVQALAAARSAANPS